MIFLGGASIIILCSLLYIINATNNQNLMQKKYFGKVIYGNINIID
jgi:hypothetical protein